MTAEAVPAPEDDDGALLRAHLAGDAHAFGRLYDRWDQPCIRFIRRLLGPGQADAAEDLHQETWIAISRGAGSFDAGRGSFRTWLFTIARRKVLDHFRRQKIVPLLPADDDAAMRMSDPAPSAALQVETRELAQAIVGAVEALPLEQKGALVMFTQGGLSLEEIAQATGVAVETAKSRLRYARARLRAALSGSALSGGADV